MQPEVSYHVYKWGAPDYFDFFVYFYFFLIDVLTVPSSMSSSQKEAMPFPKAILKQLKNITQQP
jgi:hypothetical protein